MPTAAIALGSNLGNRSATLTSAVGALAHYGKVTAVSEFLESDPVGYTDQPRFLNAALLLETGLEPLQLLDALLSVEYKHGRDRSHGIAKGPRTLDLDLLLYEDRVLTTPELTLPHPQLQHRAFVLQPLAQIAPQLRHPTLNRTIQQLLSDLG